MLRYAPQNIRYTRTLAKINFSFKGNLNDNTLKITDKILLFLFYFRGIEVFLPLTKQGQKRFIYKGKTATM
ncbi:MAG: hypothetical protein COY04_00345 [Parcubacteria group bacterium CG_4_10_14_0_2_um_filter_7_35_8]|nr:MAG: hypothetical protein COY04_00345 [Parcubacteria group bacterium CG_4_10_14_0_2_um_filter_7_35_8]